MVRKNRKAFVFTCLVAFLVALVASGCASGISQTSGTAGQAKPEIKVTDFRGKEITLETPAKRIAVLLDSSLTTLHMLGIKNEVIAIDKWTYENDAFKYVSQLEKRIANREVPAYSGNIERLVALKPDIVIMWAKHEKVEVLERRGLRVYGVHMENFNDVIKELEDLGTLTGRQQRAAEIIKYTKAQLDKVAEATAKIPEAERVRGLFIWGPTKLDVAGAGDLGQEILTLAGGRNSLSEINWEPSRLTMAQVTATNPEVVILWNSDKLKEEDVRNSALWRSVNAVRHDRIHVLPEFFYCDLWTVKYIHAVKSTAKWLYPEVFSDTDLKAESAEMFAALYGQKLAEN